MVGQGAGEEDLSFFLGFFIRHIEEGKEAPPPQKKGGGLLSEGHMLECEDLSCLARLSNREQASRLAD